MTWNGDISKMGQLARNIGKLAEVPSRASREVAIGLKGLIELEYEVGADPYGHTWEPLAQATLDKGRQEPPLTDSGKMRAETAVKPMRTAGVSITIPHPSEDHQTGWNGPQGSGPARPILPSGTFPATWNEVLRNAVGREVRGVLRRKGAA